MADIVKAEVEIPAPRLSELEPIVPKISHNAKMLSLIKKVDETRLAAVQEMMAQGKAVIKEADALLDRINRPYINLKNTINDRQRIAKDRHAEIIEPLREQIDAINKLLLQYARELEARKKAEMIQARNNLAAQSPNVTPKPGVIAPTPKGMKTRMAFKVISPIDVPREYLMVNEEGIRSAIKVGVREIKGVEIYKEEYF